MANIRRLKGGSVSSQTKLRTLISSSKQYFRVEPLDASRERWKVTHVAMEAGEENKDYFFDSERETQLFLDSL